MVIDFIKSKKSQISIFILIAAIIVILGVFYFTVNSGSMPFFADQKSSYKIEQYMDSCLQIQTDLAVNKIGQSGGWLYSPPINYINMNTNSYLVKDGTGFDFFGVKMPYWYYYDDSTKTFKFNIPDFSGPSQYSIQNQIKTYLDKTLEPDCIQGFQSFKNIYKIDYNPKEMQNVVNFTNGQIRVSTHLPIKIVNKNTNETESISAFSYSTPNKLIVPYNIARDIAVSESKSSFVEKRMLQFLTPYTSTDSRNLLPPTYDFKLGYDFAPWKVSNVENLVKEIISSNIGLIQFYGTKTHTYSLPSQLSNDPFAQGVYNSYNKDYLSQYSIVKNQTPQIFAQYKNYQIQTDFQTFFPFSFTLSPSLGNQILLPKPQASFGIFPIFFTTYSASYQMTTPILFKIRDSRNPNDKFVFNMPIEANIDHNTPLAENKNITLNTNPTASVAKSLICDPSQFISDNVYLNISDPIQSGLRKSTKDPLKGIANATVSFDCKGLSTCYIGSTKINGKTIMDNITQLKFKLPVNCDPGTLSVYKYGYTKLTFNNVNPNLNNPINLGNAKMYSEKPLKLAIHILGASDSIDSTGRSLDKYENGFLVMEDKNDQELSQIIQFNQSNIDNLSIKLVPGNYSVKAFVLYNNNISIGSQQYCYNKGLFSGSDCKTLPGFTAKSWISGSLNIPNYQVKFNKLFYNNKFVVNIIDMPLPTTYGDLSKMMSNTSQASSSKLPYFEKN